MPAFYFFAESYFFPSVPEALFDFCFGFQPIGSDIQAPSILSCTLLWLGRLKCCHLRDEVYIGNVYPLWAAW